MVFGGAGLEGLGCVGAHPVILLIIFLVFASILNSPGYLYRNCTGQFRRTGPRLEHAEEGDVLAFHCVSEQKQADASLLSCRCQESLPLAQSTLSPALPPSFLVDCCSQS